MHPTTSAPQTRHLVLLGGGHTHALLLRRLAMRPLPGIRVTLVSEGSAAPYSGMLPGHIAGVYSWEEMHIDLRRLCTVAEAAFIHAEVVGLNAASRTILLTGRPPLTYDLLSINLGGMPHMDDIPGAAEFAVPAKPVPRLLEGWSRIQTVARQHPVHPERPLRPVRLVVVGGGAGGVELALGMKRQLGAHAAITIVHRGPTVMDTHPARVRSLLSAVLENRRIQVLTSAEVTEVKADRVMLRGTDLLQVEADFVLWVTSATPAPWLGASELKTDSDGSVSVSNGLQSISHPEVFAVGDVAALPERLPRSGVYAVRMARPLADNLRRYLAGTPLRPYRPQRSFLSLIGTADGQAVASRRPWALRSAWLWRLKDSIDRRFMRKFEDLPGMKVKPQPAATAGSPPEPPAMRCRGCAAKIGSRSLSVTLDRLREDFPDVVHSAEHGDIQIGLDSPDDAAVFSTPGHLLVQTVDYLPALMDDPFLFGQIAALHAFSDVFAMGAEPHSCLATALVPFGGAALTEELLYQLLAGVATVLRQSGARLLGGHSAEGDPMALTLVCNGLLPPDGGLMTKGGLRSGDLLVLTKPLGIGLLYAAAMRLLARGRWIDAAERSMLRSNLPAGRILRAHGAAGCTDVTGFGLAGHLQEMLRASGCSALVRPDTVPLIEGALHASGLGVRSSLYESNAAAVALTPEAARFADHPHFPLLFDPQTSGGLLAGVAETQVESCLAALKTAGFPEAAVIGHILPGPAEAPRLMFS